MEFADDIELYEFCGICNMLGTADATAEHVSLIIEVVSFIFVRYLLYEFCGICNFDDVIGTSYSGEDFYKKLIKEDKPISNIVLASEVIVTLSLDECIDFILYLNLLTTS